MKWSESVTVQFVQEYLKHECLYNSKCANYRIKHVRDAALVNICNAMNIMDFGPKEALSKIKSIRSTYSQEVKKINESSKSGAGTDDVYVPTLKWFSIFHDVMKVKNLTPKESQSNLDSTMMEGTSGSLTSPDNKLEIEADRKPLYSRRRNLKHLENLVCKVKEVGEMVQTPSNDNNEFYIFGRSVAAQLNAMPLMLALRAQSHIQNYITSLRMHSIANPLNIDTYSPSPPSSTTYISPPSQITNSPISTPYLYHTPSSPLVKTSSDTESPLNCTL